MLTHLALALAATVSQTPSCPDTTDVAGFFAQFMARLPANERAPRGAFVLVCGDRQPYATGFGKTQNGAAVDPGHTLFRAASNAKFVTATAAMQLAATGRWKLTDDVNRFLPNDAKLKNGFGRQVTIGDLLTHTAGFEDRFGGGISVESERVSLASFFAHNRPMRVRPAGLEVSYSNIGIALAGYAVEAASGQSFDAYAREHIFVPLGMTRSTFAQPLPADWLGDVASRVPTAARGIVFLPYPAASMARGAECAGRGIWVVRGRDERSPHALSHRRQRRSFRRLPAAG